MLGRGGYERDTTRYLVNWYYDLETDFQGGDEELRCLCRTCGSVEREADRAMWASRGDEGISCEVCGAPQKEV